MSYGTEFFKKNRDYSHLRRSLSDRYGAEKADMIFKMAGSELDCIKDHFTDVPAGERSHTDNYIFPRAALYCVLKEEFGSSEAMAMIDEAIDIQGRKMGAMLRKFTALPLIEKVFLKIFALMAKNMFGEKNGFSQIFYSSPKGTVKFDILDCTYCRYCRLCGCPELIHTFCNSDAYCFGNLSKIRFTREHTLEHDEKCDFLLACSSSEE